jgi:hypothetical protein
MMSKLVKSLEYPTRKVKSKTLNNAAKKLRLDISVKGLVKSSIFVIIHERDISL